MAQVEARSLSAINQIAAHPPQYPINPAERHETLTLYISRVPGCRDIILSTFKPQKKVVTGEDVANSLYYLHMDSPGDELLAPKGRENDNPRSSFESTRSTDRPRINRKPLPASAKPCRLQNQDSAAPAADCVHATSPTEQTRYPPSSLPYQPKEDNRPAQGGAGPSNNQLADSARMPPPPLPAKVPIAPTPTSQRQLGPRPIGTGPPSPDAELHIHEPTPRPGAMRPTSPPTPEEKRPNLPPRPRGPPLRVDNAPPQTFDELYATRTPISRTPDLQSPVTPSRSPSPAKLQKQFTPFSLSIIRRDPGTGHQWNIGKVSSFQSTILVSQDPQNPDAPQIAQYPKGYPAINIHIETSGYARFRNFPTALPKISDMPRMSLDSIRPGSAGSHVTTRTMKDLAAQMQAQVEQQQQHQKERESTEEGFSRQVVMTYGKTWTHNIKEAFKGGKHRRGRSSADMTNNETLETPRPRGTHQRQDSSNSITSNDSFFGANEVTTEALQNSNPDPIITHPGHGLKPKGYTFASPWDGRCDFRTSSNGRGLTCRHIRNTQTQGFNPLVAAQALRDAAGASHADGSGSGSGGERGKGRTRTRGASASLPMGDTGNRVPVSELRFNLPSTDIFNSKEDRERAAEELKQGLSRLLVRSPGGNEYGDRDDDDDDEPIFDFSGLGKEKAGGGNRGKRAKLGKLLVHDEGLKMLDLVVAANMGIWWQAWERSF
ncbi:hypothetical protein VP1G_06773 [Cytospora mali]|uniref:Uncharacterized protein n=1 Tax=Cytospora mali TaxID=578113 RepID=A0A194V686_CYTMA|nr:hypothetical protein VP1G_06773 [Valsa mali var. pyri (nom. inval.)]